MDEWKDVPGFEGYYQASPIGQIRSVDRIIPVASSRQSLGGYSRVVSGKVLNSSSQKSRYPSVSLWKDHKLSQFQVGRLILTTFVGPCPDGMECCHNDGNPKNSSLENLRWDTPKANNADKKVHGTHLQGSQLKWAKLTEEDVIRIREMHACGMKQKDIGEAYGVLQNTISRIVMKRRWAHVE